ncbi:MAG: NAD-dependent epimerase/dehydratase family protein [Candidatus Methanoperedens sp.]|nr:NAD-dependent epimerase/dehydratase family protein [Candidatus Methanoperedens sp.]
MKALVTGGTGFTGRHLIARLISEGNEVRVLARKKDPELEKLRVEFILGDITDKEVVYKSVERVDKVYHLAAVFREGGGIPNKVFWDVNVNATKNLLEASLQNGVERFIHCSTCGVLGHISKPPANETYPYNPGDEYQRTKCEAEKIALDFFQKKGLPGVVVRPAAIYGPGDLRFLRLFKAINDGKFITVGSGEVLNHHVYVDDLVEGIMLCAKEKQALGEIYIIGGEEYVTLNKLVFMIAKELNVPVPKIHFPFFWPVWAASFACEIICWPFGINPPIFRRRADIFRKSRAFDISKARKELGFKPKIALNEGIKKTVEWYRKEEYL